MVEILSVIKKIISRNKVTLQSDGGEGLKVCYRVCLRNFRFVSKLISALLKSSLDLKRKMEIVARIENDFQKCRFLDENLSESHFISPFSRKSNIIGATVSFFFFFTSSWRATTLLNSRHGCVFSLLGPLCSVPLLYLSPLWSSTSSICALSFK